MYDPISRLELEERSRDKRAATFGKKGKRRGGRRNFKKKNRPKKPKKILKPSTISLKSTTDMKTTTQSILTTVQTTTIPIPTTTSMEIILPNFNDETTTISNDASTTYINPFEITESLNENKLYTLGSFYDNSDDMSENSPNIFQTSMPRINKRTPKKEKSKAEMTSKSLFDIDRSYFIHFILISFTITLCFLFCVLPLICYFYGENRRVRVFEGNMVNQLISNQKVAPSKNKQNKFHNTNSVKNNPTNNHGNNNAFSENFSAITLHVPTINQLLKTHTFVTPLGQKMQNMQVTSN